VSGDRKFSRGRRSRYGRSIALLFGASAVFVAACNQIPGIKDTEKDESHSPDVFDQVRKLDLLPRFPQQSDQGGPNAGNRVRPAVYGGTVVPAIAGAPTRPTPNGEGFELNFENAPIASVAKVVLGDILGTGYTIDPRVQGMISLGSGRPIPKQDLLFVLEDALRLSGVVMVRDSAGYRLIPLGDAVGSGNLDSAAARAEPGYGISVVPLQYVSAATLIKLLDSFATKPGTVRADTARNLLLIQGNGAERRSAIDTALSFDVDWMRGQSVGIFPIQTSNPEPIIAELEKILDSTDGGLSQNVIKFQPVARMNAILVVTRKPDLLKAAETWIRRLDNADTSRTGVHVYRVRYGEARQLARVLTDVFVGGSSNSLDTPASQVAPRSGLSSASSFGASTGSQAGAAGQSTAGGGTSTAGGTSASGGFGRPGSGSGFGSSTLGTGANGGTANALDARNPGGGGGQPILEGVRITADVSGNALLIYASQENYQLIERTLGQLDRPRAQVAIDATVAEVTLNDSLNYGVQFFIQSRNLGLKPDTGSALNIPAVSSNALNSSTTNTATSATAAASTVASTATNAFLSRTVPGFNFLVGAEAQPNVILNALHAITDVKVLTNPSLVVIDNEVATLIVGDDVPIQTGTANVLNSASATSNTVYSSIDYRSTGVILRVSPRISVNGNVRLDIEQEISQVVNSTSSTTSANPTPTISQRKVKSSISVASGQTVLLAGLIQEQKETDRSGIPGLDQIPKLGDLFSNTAKTTARTELIIFIRPQIIRDSVDAHFVAEELRTKLRGTIEAAPSKPIPAGADR
jgi:general secretion pathway protein D